MVSDLDPATIMAQHCRDPRWQRLKMCAVCTGGKPWPCLPYRLAAALAEASEREQRVRALCDRAQVHDHDGFKMTYVEWVRRALDEPQDGDPDA